MRILIITTRSCLGGAQSVVMNLANGLCSNNEVAVAAGVDDGEDASLLWKLLSPSVHQHKIKSLVKKVSPLKDVKAAIEIRNIYDDFKPDVVHLHSSKASVLGRMVLPAKKIIYTVHGFDTIRIANRKFLPLERLLQYRCSAIVGVSYYDYHNLLSEKIKHNLSVIYNGLSITPTEEGQRDEIFSKEKKNILCIARVDPPKRHDIFIETARELPDYNFVWIGNLQEMKESLPSNCHFVGNISNAGALCKYATLFVLPSDYEGLPMVIIEAMSQGLPIVASNVGGISEIVDSTNGYVVPNNPSSFAEKIRKCLENDSLYEEMSKASLERYKKTLTVDKMISQYYNIYSRISEVK